MAAERPTIPGPYEYLDLPDGGTVDLDIVNWEQGTSEISPKYEGAPPSKIIKDLRVHVRPGTKESFPYYWDLSAQTLQAQLMPLLMARDFESFTYRITKRGVAPKARFTLERIPR